MNKLMIFFLISMTFISCEKKRNKQVLRIDIKSDTTLVLKKNERQENVWGIDLKIVGDFKDTITIIQSNDDNVMYYHKCIGGIDNTFHTDWYSDSCLIKFKKIKVPIFDF